MTFFDVGVDISYNCPVSGYLEQRFYTWIGVDECGNKSSFVLIARMVDTQAPFLLGVPDTACINDLGLTEIVAFDACNDATFKYIDTNIPNPCGLGSTILRTFTASDLCGNTSEATAILFQNNPNQPLIEFANPMLSEMTFGEILVIDCNAQSGQYTALGIADVRVIGDCSMGVNIAFSEELLSTGADCENNGIVANLKLKWSATDLCGNTKELTILAQVIDKISPVFIDFQREISIGCGDTMPKLPTVYDACGQVTMTHIDSIITSDCVFEYTIKRVITATDPCGNTTTKTQFIHVGNGNGPTIIGVIPVICDDISLPIVTAYDACAQAFVPVTMQQDTLESLCKEGLVIQRTWSAKDSCGNVSVLVQNIILDDSTPPQITLPFQSIVQQFFNGSLDTISTSQTDLIYQLDDLNSSSIWVRDECHQDLEATFDFEIRRSENCIQDGFFEQRIYTWVATDACGNTASLSIIVTIMDDTPPIIINIPQDTMIICADLPIVPVLLPALTDPFASIVFSFTIESGTQLHEYIVIRKWVVTDACGNSTIYIQKITWIPNTFLECQIVPPPIVECNSHDVVICSTVTGGIGDITYDWEIVGENCFIRSGQNTPKITIYIGWSEVKIILRITDANGCTSMCMTVVDCEFMPDIALQISEPLAMKTVNFTQNTLITKEMHQSAPQNELQKLNIFPNPTNDFVTLYFESNVENEVQYSFTNLLGLVLLSDDIKATKGINMHKIEVQQLPEGRYMMQTKMDKEVHTKVVTIVRSN